MQESSGFVAVRTKHYIIYGSYSTSMYPSVCVEAVENLGVCMYMCVCSMYIVLVYFICVCACECVCVCVCVCVHLSLPTCLLISEHVSSLCTKCVCVYSRCVCACAAMHVGGVVVCVSSSFTFPHAFPAGDYYRHKNY